MMNNFFGMDLQAVLILLLIAAVILGFVKRLFKLAFFIAFIGLLIYLVGSLL